MAIAYLAGIATPIAALFAGFLAAGGLLTVSLDSISEGSSKYQFTMNGLLLIVVAVRFPAGVFGAVRSLSSRLPGTGKSEQSPGDPTGPPLESETVA